MPTNAPPRASGSVASFPSLDDGTLRAWDGSVNPSERYLTLSLTVSSACQKPSVTTMRSVGRGPERRAGSTWRSVARVHGSVKALQGASPSGL